MAIVKTGTVNGYECMFVFGRNVLDPYGGWRMSFNWARRFNPLPGEIEWKNSIEFYLRWPTKRLLWSRRFVWPVGWRVQRIDD